MLPRDIVSKFKAVNDIRLHLLYPAREEGKLYASNGHVLVVTEDDHEVNVLDNSPLPRMARDILSSLDVRDNWRPVDIALPEKALCGACRGSGKLQCCEHCDGEGEINPDEDGVPEQTCQKCNGLGEWPDPNGDPCWHCDGTGEGFLTIAVGNTFFQRRYLALLQSLPGPVELSTGPNASDTAFFRFFGGYGALMPCRAH